MTDDSRPSVTVDAKHLTVPGTAAAPATPIWKQHPTAPVEIVIVNETAARVLGKLMRFMQEVPTGVVTDVFNGIDEVVFRDYQFETAGLVWNEGAHRHDGSNRVPE